MVEKFILGALIMFATSAIYAGHLISRVPDNTSKEVRSAFELIVDKLDRMERARGK